MTSDHGYDAETTFSGSLSGPRVGGDEPVCTPGLTILAHPEGRRIGEQATLLGLRTGRAEELSRTAPEFRQPMAAGLPQRSLAERHLSRRPILFAPDAAGYRILRGANTTEIYVAGEPLHQERLISLADYERGVTIVLSGRVALLFHPLVLGQKEVARYGLVGESQAMLQLRREIERVAQVEVPILLRGETGTGKELVAEALHKFGPRRHGAFVAVNVATVPATLAATEFFGAVRGAYTGADRPREGHFVKADQGTLFLDEIADISEDVQVQLLRALEVQMIQPVGSDVGRRVNVRVLAATDQDLEQRVRTGKFRAPLLHRLNGYAVHLPPLRARRDDIARLFVHFLRQELETLGGVERLDDVNARPAWLCAHLVASLVDYPWPGNVRELRNVARQAAIHSYDQKQIAFPPTLRNQMRDPVDSSLNHENTDPSARVAPPTPPPAEPAPRRPSYRHPAEVSEQELIQALRDHGWKILPASKALNVSRTSLYALMERCPSIRKAADLSRTEIERAFTRHGGNLDEMAAELEVSKPGLQQRVRELDLG